MIQSNDNELAHDRHPRRNSDNEWQISIMTIMIQRTSVGEGEGKGVGILLPWRKELE